MANRFGTDPTQAGLFYCIPSATTAWTMAAIPLCLNLLPARARIDNGGRRETRCGPCQRVRRKSEDILPNWQQSETLQVQCGLVMARYRRESFSHQSHRQKLALNGP